MTQPMMTYVMSFLKLNPPDLKHYIIIKVRARVMQRVNKLACSTLVGFNIHIMLYYIYRHVWAIQSTETFAQVEDCLC